MTQDELEAIVSEELKYPERWTCGFNKWCHVKGVNIYHWTTHTKIGDIMCSDNFHAIFSAMILQKDIDRLAEEREFIASLLK